MSWWTFGKGVELMKEEKLMWKERYHPCHVVLFIQCKSYLTQWARFISAKPAKTYELTILLLYSREGVITIVKLHMLQLSFGRWYVYMTEYLTVLFSMKNRKMHQNVKTTSKSLFMYHHGILTLQQVWPHISQVNPY